ncbi:LacI family DNA-binding transcriptional regulator [Demequina soli]|uniref:LacI family DNA-binding transcriptional regulator n=1 Tax=Demequina soli TaxID=1638987 RepID=UPI00078126F3|nr:LacI family DNA-binding transcriptional regulator [Demequina soli]
MSDSTVDSATGRRGRKSGAPTIYDIAELAGVNPSTVSRALNQPGRVSAATEARIRAAAAELDFHINPLARALPTGRTNTLAVVVADITNPVVFGIIRGAERAASRAGFTLIIAESQESGSLEAATIDRLIPSVDGIVLATTRLPDDEITRIAARKPLVTINRAMDGVISVAPDVRPGITQLVDHLHGLGHRTVAFVSGPGRSWISERRWEALLDAARALGMSVFEIGPNSPTIEGGVRAFERVEASGATSVVAYNDLVALGLIKAAREKGIDVPRDLSVAGFDDIFGAEFISPPLTTVRADLLGAGAVAVQELFRKIGVDAAVADSEELTTELVARESTGPLPTAR